MMMQRREAQSPAGVALGLVILTSAAAILAAHLAPAGASLGRSKPAEPLTLQAEAPEARQGIGNRAENRQRRAARVQPAEPQPGPLMTDAPDEAGERRQRRRGAATPP